MGAKDIIIGAAAGYEWTDVEVWAESLVASGFTGLGAVIVSDQDRRGDLVAENLESLGLYAVRMPLRDSVYNHQFEDIAHVLQTIASSLRFAVVTDVRDVYFQTDPIEWLVAHLDRPFLAASESLRYSDEGWSRENLQRTFPEHVDRLWSKAICNVGVLAGQAGMMADLCLAITRIAESSGQQVAAQSGYNLLLDMEPYRSTVQLVTSEDGFACQAGTVADPAKIATFRPFLLEPEPTLAADGVRTAAGKLYPIVHQYDRVPEWNQALRNRLLSAPVLEAVRNAWRPPGTAPRASLAGVLRGTNGTSIAHAANTLGVPRESSSIRLYSGELEHPVPDDSPAPRVSVVCPTYQRPELLRTAVRHYCSQTYDGGMELIILDDSPEPADFLDEKLCHEHRIRYYHVPNNRMTLGDKLNLMTQLARGEIIVEFDDDDYYAPQYIERMIEFLGDADFVTLSRWFAYDPANKIFCYWSTDILSPTHFVLSPWEPIDTTSTKGWPESWVDGKVWGYGFSFVWRKSTYPEVEIRGYPPGGNSCDLDFTLSLQKAGFKTVCVADTEGLVLHILHPKSSVRMFPQYVLPDFLIPNFFPLYSAEEI
ncbi:glycosyltransferase [Nocardia sp. KC 131]|uniref:glycosyltransferase n=1 Tax=Nocardia arseniciresistens TaxID=3392119 RepID=UPI00398E6C54